MLNLDPETVEAFKEYHEAVAEMAKSMDYATRELLTAQKTLIHAGQGLQGFLKEVNDYSINRQIKANKS